MKSVMRNFLLCRLVDRADKEKNLSLDFYCRIFKKKKRREEKGLKK